MIRVLDSAGSTLVEWGRQQQQEIDIHLKYCQPFTLVLTFIKHFTNKVEKLRASIASEHVTSTLVTGTTAAIFSSFEEVSQLTANEYILISAPKSCVFDPIHSKLLIECLDFILPSLTDLFSSSLASSHNASYQILSHLFSKRGILITMI